MGRQAKYTPEQKDTLKRLRNSEYYYRRKLKLMTDEYNTQVGNAITAKQMVIDKIYVNTSGAIRRTFLDVKQYIHKLVPDDQSLLYYSGAFHRDVYDTIDIRDFAINYLEQAAGGGVPKQKPTINYEHYKDGSEKLIDIVDELCSWSMIDDVATYAAQILQDYAVDLNTYQEATSGLAETEEKLDYTKQLHDDILKALEDTWKSYQ